MCGIAGKFNFAAHSGGAVDQVKLTELLLKRGPDNSGIWSDAPSCQYLYHSRLSIIELGAVANQPIKSACGRYVLVYNGEIYNFTVLRQKLIEDKKCPSDLPMSDTIILLSFLEHYGIDKTLTSVEGMFAFCLYDREDKKIYLARDRMGEKPLFYLLTDQTFVFSSRVDTFPLHEDLTLAVNENCLKEFLRRGTGAVGATPFENVLSLLPAHVMTINLEEIENGQNGVKIRRYSSLPRRNVKICQNTDWNEDESLAKIDELLNKAVSRQMTSDVPVGVLLSGGIDSSLVTAYAAQSNSGIKTFSVAFDSQMLNEASYARHVAEHFDTQHHEIICSDEMIEAEIQNIMAACDAPFADFSTIPTYLVSKFARTHVGVALTGDGADEVFGGYRRHTHADNFKKIYRFRNLLRKILWLTDVSYVSSLLEYLDRSLFLITKIPRMGISHNLDKLNQLISAPDEAYLYLSILSYQDTNKIGVSLQPSHNQLLYPETSDRCCTAHEFMDLDMANYLVEDVLVKGDRASMANSLELRTPFLDPSLVDYSFSLPRHALFGKNKGKLILRELLSRHMDSAFTKRGKMGFAPPINDWLRGPLSLWGGQLIQDDWGQSLNFLDKTQIRDFWNRFLRHENENGQLMWNVLCLLDWNRRVIK